jgi:cobalt-zinc-cadmium efflux system protein
MHLKDSLKKEKKAFIYSIIIAFGFMILEFLGGFFANSLALISDALHMFSDVGSLLLGVIVIAISKRPPSVKKSFGYDRAEILGAIASGSALWALMIFLIYEAFTRLISPPAVKGPVVLVIAFLGLIANLLMFRLLHPSKHGSSMNIRAAYLHVLGDLLGSIGVLISGFVIWIWNWNLIDPIVTFFISALILRSSSLMIKEAIDILMEGVPKHISLEKVEKDLLSIEGIKEVHDLHIWSLSTRKACLSAHLISDKKILDKVHKLIQKKYDIHHMTIQIEHPKEFDPKWCFDTKNRSRS